MLQWDILKMSGIPEDEIAEVGMARAPCCCAWLSGHCA